MSEAVAEAKQRVEPIVTLSTGVRVRIRPVALETLRRAVQRITEPKVPIWHNPDKDRDEENPNDPDYLLALAEFRAEQFRVSTDVWLVFGTELVDGLPADDTWLRQLKLLEREDVLDLSAYDLTDPVDLDFLYKRHIAFGQADAGYVSTLWGVKPEEVAAAAAFFPTEPIRGAD